MRAEAGYCAAMTATLVDQPPESVAARRASRGQRNEDQWPLAWVLCAVGAVIALATWQKAPGWGTLITAAVGTLGAAICTRWVRKPRAWAIGAVLALTGTAAVSARETATLQMVADDWGSWSAQER